MKIEILFRGLRIDGGGWVCGFYFYDHHVDLHYIIDDTSNIEVIPESVGQFTGLTDKNGKKIFEGDKLRDDWFNDLDEIVDDYCVVVWDLANGQWAIDNSFKKDGSYYTNLVEYLGQDNLEIIGNIHENN